MIVITIAYGEKYIRRLFERCLPSLLTPNNLPGLTGLSPELAIFTLEQDAPMVEQYLRGNSAIEAVFGPRIEVQPFRHRAGAEESGEQNPRWKTNLATAYHMLCRAVHHCVQKDKSFFLAVPDLVYSDGLVKTCWALHRLSGKIVSVFNGRVCPPDGIEAFSHEQILAAAARPNGLSEFFFNNLNFEWRRYVTINPDIVTDPVAGKQILFSDTGTYIFLDSPNPTLGKFTTDDLVYICESRVGMSVWDRPWQDYLLKNDRVLVQPDMDLCMSIEPEETFWDPNWARSLERNPEGAKDPVAARATITAKLGLDKSDAARKVKFTYRYNNFVFTSRYRP